MIIKNQICINGLKAFLIALVTGLALLVVGCEFEPVQTTTPVAPVETVQPATPPSSPFELELEIGDTAEGYGLRVTVISVEVASLYIYEGSISGDDRAEQAPDGKQFLIADVEIVNVGQGEEFTGRSDFIVLDSTGLRYDPTFYSGQDSLSTTQLSPAQRIQGKIIFEISDNLPEYKIVYEFGNPFIQTQLAAWNVSVDQGFEPDDVSVNVSSAEIISHQVYYQETTELKGYVFEYPSSSLNEFLKINVEIINAGTEPMSVTPEIFSIITAPYGSLSKSTPYLGEDGLPELTLAPNETVEGSVLFEVSRSIDSASLFFIPTRKVIMSLDADILLRNSVNSFEVPLGEFAYVDNVGIVVYETDRRTSYSYYSDILDRDIVERASQDKVFIIADIEVVNVGMEEEFTGRVDFSAADSTGLRYDPAFYLGDDELDSISLLPGLRIQGKVLFEVEADSPGVQVIYENSYPTPILISWVDG